MSSSSQPIVARTTYRYDRRGRLLRIDEDFESDGKIDRADHHSYDERDHLIEKVNADRVERYQRDREGRVVVHERQETGSSHVSVVTTTYDERGRPAREQSDLEDVHYSYDPTGRQVREQRVPRGEAAFRLEQVTLRDEAGRLLLQRATVSDAAAPERCTKRWRYDERGRELEMLWHRDDQLLFRALTSYDAAGRRVRVERFDGQGALVAVETWSYDALGAEASYRLESLDTRRWLEERYTYTAPRKCRR